MFESCSFITSVYGTFHSPKNRKHNPHTLKAFKPGVVKITAVSQESHDNTEKVTIDHNNFAFETAYACSSSDVDLMKNLPEVIEQKICSAQVGTFCTCARHKNFLEKLR